MFRWCLHFLGLFGDCFGRPVGRQKKHFFNAVARRLQDPGGFYVGMVCHEMGPRVTYLGVHTATYLTHMDPKSVPCRPNHGCTRFTRFGLMLKKSLRASASLHHCLGRRLRVQRARQQQSLNPSEFLPRLSGTRPDNVGHQIRIPKKKKRTLGNHLLATFALHTVFWDPSF